MDITVNFYERVADELLKFAVIITKADGKYVFAKHRERETLEIPGGHREEGENILEAAKRELYEETGATDFTIKPVCVYSVIAPWNFNGQESFGMLYYAEVREFEKELHSEIEKIILLDKVPEVGDTWTYPEIQPKLIEEFLRRHII